LRATIVGDVYFVGNTPQNFTTIAMPTTQVTSGLVDLNNHMKFFDYEVNQRKVMDILRKTVENGYYVMEDKLTYAPNN